MTTVGKFPSPEEPVFVEEMEAPPPPPVLHKEVKKALPTQEEPAADKKKVVSGPEKKAPDARRKPIADKTANKPKLPPWDFTWLGMDISPQLYIDARNPNDKEGALRQLIDAIQDKLKDDEEVDDAAATNLKTLREAVTIGTPESVQKFIQLGEDVSAFNLDKKEPPLVHVAVWREDAAILKLLLDAGANVDAKGEFGRTPLLAAAAQRGVGIVSLLLDYNPDIKAVDANKSTALDLAAGSNTGEVCELLIKRGAPMETKNKIGYTPLFTAVSLLNMETTKVLVEHNADCTVIEPLKMQSIMHVAAGSEPTGEGIHVVKYLVEAGCDTGLKDIHGFTPIVWAIHEGHTEIAEYLVNLGVDLVEEMDNDTDANMENENSIIQLCCHYGYLDLLKVIIPKVPIDVVKRKTDDMQWTPMTFSIARGHVEISIYLHSIAPELVNEKTSDQLNLLSIAASHGQLKSLEWLLGASGIKFDLEDHDVNLMTPLLHSVSGKKIEVFEYLLKHGAKMDARMPNEQNEINIAHVCCTEGNVEFLKRILEIDPNAKSMLEERSPGSGYTGLNHAVYDSRVLMIEYLHSIGVDFNTRTYNGDHIVGFSLHNSDVETLRCLLKLTANTGLIDSPDYEGRPPLRDAMDNNDAESVEELLKHNASTTVNGYDSLTLLEDYIGGNTDIYADILEYMVAAIPVGTSLERLDVKVQGTLTREMVSSGKLENFKMLLDRGITLAARKPEYNCKLLCTAAVAGDADLFRAVKEQIPNASVDDADSSSLRPVDHAAASASTDIIKYLFEIGANFDTLGDDRETLLCKATESEDLDCLKEVRKAVPKHVSWDAPRKADGFTPLYIAVGVSNLELVQYLVQEGASLEVRLENGRSILHHAAQAEGTQHMEVLQFLVEKAPKSLSLNDEEDTDSRHSPLSLALQKSSPSMIEYLVSQTAMPWSAAPKGKRNLLKQWIDSYWASSHDTLLAFLNAITEPFPEMFDFQPFANAIFYSQSNFIVPLLKKLAAIGMHLDTNDFQLELLRTSKGNLKIFKFLESHWSPEILSEYLLLTDDSGWNALCFAVSVGSLESVSYFHTLMPTSVTMKTKSGQNLLHIAASRNDSDSTIMKYMLDVVPSEFVNGRDNEGKTPLICGADAAAAESVKLLLAKNADPSLEMYDGTTLFKEWISVADSYFTLDIFRACVAVDPSLAVHIDSEDYYKDTPLKIFSRKNRVEDLKECIKYGASISHENNDQKNALLVAASNESFDALKYLLSVAPPGIPIEMADGTCIMSLALEKLDVFYYLLDLKLPMSTVAKHRTLVQAISKGLIDVVMSMMKEMNISAIEEKLAYSSVRSCDNCGKDYGDIYCCKMCTTQYDLCAQCFPQAKEIHNDTHEFYLAFDTAALAAIAAERVHILKEVLERYGKPLSDEIAQPLLSNAVKSGLLEAVQLVLKHAASPASELFQKVDEKGWTPSHYVAEGGRVQVLRWIQSQGIPMHKTSTDRSVLSLSAEMITDERSFVPMLLASLDEVEVPDSKGWTPLCYALQKGNSDAVKALIESGASADITLSDEKLTSLYDIAFDASEVDLYFRLVFPATSAAQVSKFLQRPASEESSDDTFMDRLIYSDCMDTFTHLAKVSPEALSAEDPKGWTPLAYALRYEGLTACEFLVKAGVPLDQEMSGEPKSLTAIADSHSSWQTYFLCVFPRLSVESVAKLMKSSGIEDTSFISLIVKYGNLATLRNLVDLLKSNSILTDADEKGWTLLCYAFENGKDRVVDYLLDHGATFEVELKGEEKSVLDICASNGTIYGLYTILDRIPVDLMKTWAEAPLFNYDEETLLIRAIRQNDLVFVKYLKRIGVVFGSDLIKHAGTVDMLKYLLVNASLDPSAPSPLATAMTESAANLVQYLLSKKVPTDGLVEAMQTVIAQSYTSINLDILKMGLAAMAKEDISNLDMEVMQRLYLCAAYNADYELAATLDTLGVPVSTTVHDDDDNSNEYNVWGIFLDPSNRTTTVNFALLDFFLKRCDSAIAKLSSSFTALHAAVSRGDLKVAKRIVAKYGSSLDVFAPYIEGDRTNLKYIAGYNAVHMAAYRGYVEILEWLKTLAGADFNAVSSEKKFTALHIAILDADFQEMWDDAAIEVLREKVVKTLIELGADVNLADAEGHTPLDFAEHKKREPIMKMLKEAGATNGVPLPEDYDFSNEYGDTEDEEDEDEDDAEEGGEDDDNADNEADGEDNEGQKEAEDKDEAIEADAAADANARLEPVEGQDAEQSSALEDAEKSE
ncbi:ankyrin repeat-containing domain protein [Chytriomyces cf. hyalinus JEL632]|nr:ankyrin repeat-containing domain protein [Chytriomyces cf. hyalinus JEL632]